MFMVSLCILGGVIMFMYSSEYILLTLLYMEFIAISSLFMYMYYYEFMVFNYWYIIYLLVFMVCDAVLGLSLLIMIIRFYGHNFLGLMFLTI